MDHPKRETIFLMHKTRSRRATIACSHCRKRKIKCVTNRKPPHRRCDRCEKRGLQCEYVSVASDQLSPPSRTSTASPPQVDDDGSSSYSSASRNGSTYSLPIDTYELSDTLTLDRNIRRPQSAQSAPTPVQFHHDLSAYHLDSLGDTPPAATPLPYPADDQSYHALFGTNAVDDFGLQQLAFAGTLSTGLPEYVSPYGGQPVSSFRQMDSSEMTYNRSSFPPTATTNGESPYYPQQLNLTMSYDNRQTGNRPPYYHRSAPIAANTQPFPASW